MADSNAYFEKWVSKKTTETSSDMLWKHPRVRSDPVITDLRKNQWELQQCVTILTLERSWMWPFDRVTSNLAPPPPHLPH